MKKKQSVSSQQVCSTSTAVFEQMLRHLGDQSVEFQLPDWLKQQKSSMPCTFIKRNVYITKRVKRRAEDDGIFCSCASSSGLSAVCDRDCLCGMLLSSCSKSCKCGDSCVNKPFQYRPVKMMKLFKEEGTRRMIGHARERDDVYCLEESTGKAGFTGSSPLSFLSESFSSNKDKFWPQHFYLGHPSFSILKIMFPLLFKGIR